MADEIAIHALAQRNEEREHHQHGCELDCRKQHVQSRMGEIAGACGGHSLDFDAARHRALGLRA
jgi:hypothetical protein